MAIATTASGASIAWDSFGDAALPPIILIQGFSAQMIGWRPGFCQRLADEGFHVIRFDNRDVGQSQRYPQGGYALADMADDTAALLDALGLRSAHVVGQSMGGMVAQALVERHPQRVRSLGLVYTAGSDRHLIGRGDIEGRMAMAVPQSREEYVPYYVEQEAACSSPAYPQDIAWLTELGGQAWDRGWDADGAQRQMPAVLGFVMQDRSEALRAIRVPTTILAGDGDQLIGSAASAELHGLIAGSSLRIFPGMGHELPPPLWDEISGLLADNARLAEASARGQ